jgi:two-component system NarL family response regulator
VTIRVLLADDHRMFREALAGRLATEPDLAVVAEASSGAETLDQVARHGPDIVVLDIGLPDMTGIQAAERIAKEHPEVRVVALSGHADRLYVEQMLKAGARGYVVKSSGADELISAIQAAMSGHVFLSPEVTAKMVRHLHNDAVATPPPLTVLGAREQEVLSLLADGLRSAEIASQLGIAAATVEVHRRNIKRKLGLHTTAELTRYAIREGLHSL